MSIDNAWHDVTLVATPRLADCKDRARDVRDVLEGKESAVFFVEHGVTTIKGKEI